jgi:hypothetical protein
MLSGYQKKLQDIQFTRNNIHITVYIDILYLKIGIELCFTMLHIFNYYIILIDYYWSPHTKKSQMFQFYFFWTVKGGDYLKMFIDFKST